MLRVRAKKTANHLDVEGHRLCFTVGESQAKLLTLKRPAILAGGHTCGVQLLSGRSRFQTPAPNS